MKKRLVGVIGFSALLLQNYAAAADFSACYEQNYLLSRNAEVTPETQESIATWRFDKFVITCEVNALNQVVEFTQNGKKKDIQNEISFKRQMDRIDRAKQGDYSLLIEDTQKYLENELKDPASAEFRNVYIAAGGSPYLCGEFNAKNSYGAYIGFRKFHYLMTGLEMIEGKGALAGSFSKFHQDACGKKLQDIEFSMKANSTEQNDLAGQLERLSQLKQQGLLSEAEFELAKAKLLK